MSNKKNKGRFINFLGYGVSGIFLIFIVVFFVKDNFRAQEIDNEIKQLESDISTLETENKELVELIRFFDTQGYAEKKARTELGLIKPGEKLVIISDDIETSDSLNSEKEDEEKISNPALWWDYFFDKKK